MAASAVYNFNDIIQGTTFPGVTLTVYVNGSPLNLSGASITMVFNNGQYTWSTSTGELTITNPAGGEFTVDSQVVSLRKERYHYYMRFNLSGGIIKKYITGIWRVE